MAKPRPLSVKRLRAELAPEKIPYADSREIPDSAKIQSSQPRAFRALELGLAIKDTGYNIFVAGEANLGRTYLVRRFLEPRAKARPCPRDLAYVFNFSDPDRPRILSLPPGDANALRKGLDTALAAIRKEIPERLEQESFARKTESLLRTFQNKKEDHLRDMEQKASTQGFELEVDEQGQLTLYPLVEGKVVSELDYDKLDSALRSSLKKKGDEIQTELAQDLRQISREEKAYQSELDELTLGMIRGVLDTHLTPIEEKYAAEESIVEFLKEIREDVVENRDKFLPQPAQAASPLAFAADAGQDDFFYRYTLSRFVDNSETDGAPVIFENHPTMTNLLGCIERQSELGALYTDFTLIKAGALHRANGGFLVLRVEDLMQEADAWDGLLRALRAGKSKIEDSQEPGISRTKGIEPEPVPLDVKVLLIGTDEMYESLLTLDDRFGKLFKLKAHMQDAVDRTAANIKNYILTLGRIISDSGLLPFDREALAGLVDYSSRMVEDQKKMSLQLPLVRELMIEASALSVVEGRKLVTRETLDKARADRNFRSNLYEEEFMGDYDRQLIKVATTGEAVGRVNGLAVTMYGDYEFGLPHQIACTVGVGHGGIMDLEREAELGGPIHTKGMMILKSYLLRLFAQDKPLVLTGSLCFEQSYVEVDGDSASGAELASLLSALSGVPIKHSLAFTGAVSQSGAIMAVGGVNRKIEGFFQVCRRRGLTGEQGVLLPKDNVIHLMLSDDVVEAVRQGMFHIYPVESIDQALEILTDIPTGTRRASGKFPSSSLYHRVDRRLAELAELAAKQADEE
ncbi:Lon protease family protein [Desulfobaculum bizertense]|uniref:endopeptidase La n=1 Tax=Desulfobaculum bizertense DSM 18034 TaxID=1121442 RepID=A0A1T4WC98_9BACT|nr:ATP-binding protein [Desulfobaculum bizertense]SKA74555.1 Predicted ATP-dependent protease [Desulfobaculum bizertense DSM 18034]